MRLDGLDERFFVGTFNGMRTQHTKRGRPAKSEDRRKADYLDIRLEAAEKKTFRDAAVLAGLDLSAWVRERLRMLARKELEAAGQTVAFLRGSKSATPTQGVDPMLTAVTHKADARLKVKEARYVHPSRMFLCFADGLQGIWTFDTLALDMSNVKPNSIKASENGKCVEVRNKWNEGVQLDTSSLRARIDPMYANELAIALDTLSSRIGP